MSTALIAHTIMNYLSNQLKHLSEMEKALNLLSIREKSSIAMKGVEIKGIIKPRGVFYCTEDLSIRYVNDNDPPAVGTAVFSSPSYLVILKIKAEIILHSIGDIYPKVGYYFYNPKTDSIERLLKRISSDEEEQDPPLPLRFYFSQKCILEKYIQFVKFYYDPYNYNGDLSVLNNYTQVII